MFQVVDSLGPQLPATEACFVAFAAERLAQRKVPTDDERLAIGRLLWAWGETLDSYNLQDKHLDSAYRKLMAHDRRTMAGPPYPLPN